MGVGLYLLIAFFVFFFTYKLKVKSFKKEGGTSSYSTDLWVERPSFWYIVLVPLLWFIAVPALVMWRILEVLTRRYFNN